MTRTSLPWPPIIENRHREQTKDAFQLFIKKHYSAVLTSGFVIVLDKSAILALYCKLPLAWQNGKKILSSSAVKHTVTERARVPGYSQRLIKKSAQCSGLCRLSVAPGCFYTSRYENVQFFKVQSENVQLHFCPVQKCPVQKCPVFF